MKRITAELLEDVLQRKMLRYDKAGEEHYNLISALHKSVRNSDPDAALYWLGRMMESGEEPLYLARRMVRMASEDIGMAEPGALAVTLAAKEAFHFLGAPEGHLALAQAAVYLCLAPKSNAVYAAYGNVMEDVQKSEADPVPLHLRNAVTGLMKNVGYGKGYKYAHNFEERVTEMQCLPDNLLGRVYYKPTDQGFEVRLRAADGRNCEGEGEEEWLMCRGEVGDEVAIARCGGVVCDFCCGGCGLWASRRPIRSRRFLGLTVCGFMFRTLTARAFCRPEHKAGLQLVRDAGAFLSLPSGSLFAFQTCL